MRPCDQAMGAACSFHAATLATVGADGAAADVAGAAWPAVTVTTARSATAANVASNRAAGRCRRTSSMLVEIDAPRPGLKRGPLVRGNAARYLRGIRSVGWGPMLTLHHWNGAVVIAACVVAGAVAFVARWRPSRSSLIPNLIALAQTLVAAQIGIGLLLIVDGKRAPERLHYAYGVFALVALLAPFLYAPNDPRTRLLWFGVAALVAAALAVRAYMTAT